MSFVRLQYVPTLPNGVLNVYVTQVHFCRDDVSSPQIPLVQFVPLVLDLSRVVANFVVFGSRLLSTFGDMVPWGTMVS